MGDDKTDETPPPEPEEPDKPSLKDKLLGKLRKTEPAADADAAWLTASDSVDLIVGHHAHVVQPIEQVNGVWVVFGLGNVLSNLPTSSTWPARWPRSTRSRAAPTDHR